MPGLIRPELRAALARWREVLIGLGVVLAGLWLFGLGGLFFQAAGALSCALGLALGLVALRRLRFRRDGSAPGAVEVTEGQITYLAARGGGFAARSEITAVALGFAPGGQAQWRISQTGAPPLAIPVAALGAEALFDAFVALPGAQPSRFLAALDRNPADGPVIVWQRNAAPALT
ncbi:MULTISPECIES: hypothetical protein [Actibacterium]|uniref:Uncharacterized protein n=1 Tax=Actibacterium naphthalenivorans TaxID=1614693 RepID=A0A840CBD9_9RHOB|nr:MULTISPECIES: hypothetical protein [Actibacterium]MBB4022715.1 hypothetical protein [Actibacterium naphthalenivorans]